VGADELLRHLVAALEDVGVPYAIGGSMASIAYGEPRATLDIDVVVSLRSENLGAFCEHFPPGDFYLSRDAARIAIRGGAQFNIIHPASGMKIDVFSDKADAVSRSQIERGRRLQALEGLTAVFSSAEELIVKKLQYYQLGASDKHLRDVRSMLDISAEEIDLERIEDWVERLGLLEEWALVSDTRG
jgi:hypothetical protein